jgi:ArsR family transcriptional regulator
MYSHIRIGQGVGVMAIPGFEELQLLHNQICPAVGDPKRMLILYTLFEKSRNVSELAEALKMPQPTISRHLAVLRQSGMVDAERDGAAVIYSIRDTRIISILDTMRQLLRDSLERQTTQLLES